MLDIKLVYSLNVSYLQLKDRKKTKQVISQSSLLFLSILAARETIVYVILLGELVF